MGEAVEPFRKAVVIATKFGFKEVPKSRQNPQYNRDALERRLQEAGIGYEYMKALGGLRRPRRDSPNTGWRNESFRGYADSMQTVDFASALDGLIRAAAQEPVVVMCAEAVPWRCHRSLIADSPTACGYPVEHIMSATKSNPHMMTSFAKLEGHRSPAGPM